MSQQLAQDLRLLKVIVIALAVLLALSLCVLIYGLLRQTGGAARGAAFPIALPDSAQIADMALSGRQLALHVEGPSGQEILLIDVQSGRVVKTLPVVKGAWAAKIAPPELKQDPN